jgi:hypothetical protein
MQHKEQIYIYKVEPSFWGVMMMHNLGGSVITELDSTNCSAFTSPMDQIGRFANARDKLHNLTQVRHDFKHQRNISTSFNTKTFMCTLASAIASTRLSAGMWRGRTWG